MSHGGIKLNGKLFKGMLTGSVLRDSSHEKKRWPQKVKAISMHLEVQEVKVKRHSLQGHSEIYINAVEYHGPLRKDSSRSYGGDRKCNMLTEITFA